MYSCPMHPQIQKEGPGDCPICKMALEPSSPSSEKNPELKQFTLRFWICLVLTIPLFFLSPWLQLVLVTPTVLYGGFPLYTKGILTRHINMFTLITIGVSSAYLYSWWALFNQRPVYFEAAGFITTLVLLGQMLELKARERTGDAIKALLDLSPKKALLENGEEVPLEEVEKGAHIRVQPGTAIPLDGTLINGEGLVDESMISGESNPIEKKQGDAVIGGSMNQSGSFVYEVSHVGEETLLAKMIAKVQEAQSSKAPIQRLADLASGYFVPFVLLCALATFLGWGFAASWQEGLIHAISTLIIACPCALGLATPLSIKIGVGKAAQNGILFKNASAIENLRKVDTLLIDKTGTLTEGKISLEEIIPLTHQSKEELHQMAASLEVGSEHPLGKAIVQNQTNNLLDVQNFQTQAGKGVQGTIQGQSVQMGKAEEIPEAETFRKQGKTVLCLFINQSPAALFILADRIKEKTPKAIEALQQEHIQPIMVTGDHQKTAASIAEQLHLNSFYAEVMPEKKLELVNQYKKEKHFVAMAGDGINDAPALAAADVSIAMGGGTDVAMQASDLTLLHGDLEKIVTALHLSQKIVANIKQNLTFAFLYNTLAIPIAMASYLSPIIASLAMTLSSLSIVLNALRLNRLQIR